MERQVARHEATPQSGKPDNAGQMQLLLAMAKLASLYVEADRAQDAWPLGDKMLARLEAMFGPDHPNIVGQLEANASSLALQGRYTEAERLRKRAIAINERAFGSDSQNVAVSLQGMAHLFRLQERHEETLAFANRALAIAERKLAANDAQRATFLSQVADAHMQARRFDAAEPLLKQALAIIEASAGADTPLRGMQSIQYLQSLALAYYGRRRPAEARPYIDRALATSTRVFGPEHTLTGAMLMTLGLQLSEQDQLDEAERLFSQALPISEKNSSLQSVLADNYTGLGLIAFKRRNWPNAYALLRKASVIAIELERITSAGSAQPPRNRIAPNADVLLLAAVAAYRNAEVQPTEAVALRDDAFLLAQRAERSVVGATLAQMSARLSAGTGPLSKLVRERQDLAVELQHLDKRNEGLLLLQQSQREIAEVRTLRVRITEISGRLDAIDAKVAQDFPDFAKISDPAPLAIEEVQRLLQPREVMIFISHRLNQSLVWAINRDAVAWELVPVGEEELVREIGALRCGFDESAWLGEGERTCIDSTGKAWQPGEPLPFDLARSHALYRSLLAPFAPMTEGAHLIIATSGPLAAFPFATLVSEPPGAGGYANAAWLAKRNAISNLPSVSSLKALRVTAKSSRATRPFFGIANPLLAGPDASYAGLAQMTKANRTCAATLRSAANSAGRALPRRRSIIPYRSGRAIAPVELIRTLAPLPETASEVCAVAKDFGAGEGDIRLAEAATESEIKRLSASGELANYRIVHFATHGALAGQVSAASEPGLILSPPRTGTANDDGYLAASEIAGLRLDADWVILSACNTAGAGKSGAEALSGIARAFFYAQARSVLASHWEVDSAATVELITTAANAVQRDPGIGRAEALRRAMKSLIDKVAGERAHPRFWAPFALVGEGGG
ncbi:MAG: CHAT domain-containing tetratricopeptide repeat protein [Hyphomicrobiaceae bacterium]